MELVSPAFESRGDIPVRHTCDGDDSSPPLSWSGAPQDTRSFALIMDDPDAPPGTWVHWVLYDLPAETERLQPGIPDSERLEGGGVHGACWGVKSYSRTGYHGPCPPPGPPHRYVFRLYALDDVLGLPPGLGKEQLLEAMEGHVLAEAELIGRYGR
jgi:Raf kinase inhibitor-like YbhB/YbcL family protein